MEEHINYNYLCPYPAASFIVELTFLETAIGKVFTLERYICRCLLFGFLVHLLLRLPWMRFTPSMFVLNFKPNMMERRQKKIDVFLFSCGCGKCFCADLVND